ncbi:MAG: metallophosphoesterase [Eubacteriales bacterium]|nr:metallophosphoesterase [Eubacteriales bacterium]
MRVLTSYTLHTGKLSRPYTFAVVSDLHDEPYEDLWPMIDGADALLVPGDITNRYTQSEQTGLSFLRDAAHRLPTFYSLGNHEARLKNTNALISQMKKTRAKVLINQYVRFGELWIGGWYNPKYVWQKDMMDTFEGLPGCKVLLCHKPDDYIQYLRERDVDLVVSGHAHGGQIRLLNRGMYSPGQHFFPKYTKGIVDNRMVISAGAGNPNGLPRWNNPCEVLRITLD